MTVRGGKQLRVAFLRQYRLSYAQQRFGATDEGLAVVRNVTRLKSLLGIELSLPPLRLAAVATQLLRSVDTMVVDD